MNNITVFSSIFTIPFSSRPLPYNLSIPFLNSTKHEVMIIFRLKTNLFFAILYSFIPYIYICSPLLPFVFLNRLSYTMKLYKTINITF